jgi:hypothetical protein
MGGTGRPREYRGGQKAAAALMWVGGQIRHCLGLMAEYGGRTALMRAEELTNTRYKCPEKGSVHWA